MRVVSHETQRYKLIHVVTVPGTLGFFRGQLDYIKQHGYDVSVVASPGDTFERMVEELSVRGYAIPMKREISPWRDIVALFRLWRLFRLERPHIVHGHTPKAGLLSMLAAALAGVPVRIYHLHGLRFETAKGLKRLVLKLTEWLACFLAHKVIAVSPSVAQAVVKEGMCAQAKISVLANGSGNGVDAKNRFNPKLIESSVRTRLRQQYRIPDDAVVLGFVGRLVKDKGIVELVDAWRIISAKHSNLHLVVVGGFESGDPVPEGVRKVLETGERIHLTGRVSNMPEVYRMIDVLLLPTYREGLPNVLLEAAAMEKPVVATRVTGCVDAVLDGITGLLVPARDAGALAEAALTYIENPELRLNHGRAGRKWVLKQFVPEIIWDELRKEYDRLVSERVNRAIVIGGDKL